MKIFVRIGGFYQLMSFLSSVGCLMEESRLQTALEYVYAQLTVGHMFDGKAYAFAVGGHMLRAFGRLIFSSGRFPACKIDQDI